MDHLRAAFPDASPDELEGYLKMRKGDAREAESQYRSTLAWRASRRPVTIADVAPFMRSANGASGPDGCVVCLEDMKGGCHRDRKGRPIVASIGMMHGTPKEMQEQMTYALDRAMLYSKPGQLQAQCSVVDVNGPEGATKTFRFPDKPARSVMDMQRQHYPGSAVGSTTHFCGLPRAVTWAFVLCKPFMAKETYDNMILKPNFSHLSGKHIDAEHMPREWGGELDWDINAYIAWRAQEEGDVVLDEAAVRQYDAEAQAAIGAGGGGAGGEDEDANMLESMSSAAMDALGGEGGVGGGAAAAEKTMGPVYKRGSGVGMFASTKWKEKLLCVTGGSCVYWDSTEISEKNKAARFLQLTGAYAEAVDKEMDKGRGGSKGFMFRVVAPARSFTFSCASEEERAMWLEGFRREIDAAAAAARGEGRGEETGETKE